MSIAVLADSVSFSFEQMAADAPWAMAIADREGKTLWINNAFTQMCGHSLDDMLGKKPGQVLQGKNTDPEVAATLSRSIKERKSCHVVILNYHKDGHPYWADIHLTPVIGKSGKAEYFFSVIHEVSEQVQERKELEQFAAELFTINSILVESVDDDPAIPRMDDNQPMSSWLR